MAISKLHLETALNLKMNFELINASPDHRDVIQNLMQFYIYDFTEYLGHDVEADGLFKAYADLDEYWIEGTGKYPYMIKRDGKLAGFILVNEITTDKKYFSIAEFFIMRKYRRSGIGKPAAKQIFDLHKGDWQVHQREINLPAWKFWINVMREYTQDNFTERIENGRRIQNFKS